MALGRDGVCSYKRWRRRRSSRRREEVEVRGREALVKVEVTDNRKPQARLTAGLSDWLFQSVHQWL